MDFLELVKNTESIAYIPATVEVYEYSQYSGNIDQRTDDWFESRRGRFTGSGIKELMKTTRTTAKAPWGTPEKLFDFSDTALKYIYSKAKERQRGYVLNRSIGKNGEYGEACEAIVWALLKEKYPNTKFSTTGFLEFIEGVAGASPDGIITTKSKKGVLEIKSATTWEAECERTQTIFDEKHQDFWQIQAEMLAVGASGCMYAVAEPSKLIADPDISNINIMGVSASEIHQNALIQRCRIGNHIINEWLKDVSVNFFESAEKAITNFAL